VPTDSSGSQALSTSSVQRIGHLPVVVLDDFRCICADLRNANPGQSSGPLEIDSPWDAYTDDQLGLMDHLGIREFMVMGFCIGGPMIHNLIRRAPERVVAAAMMQPSGFRPEIPDLFYQNNIKGWGPLLCEKRPDVTLDMVHDFLTSMYTNRADFVFTVSRDFVRSIQTPLLVAPDDVPAHPYKVAMEVASLAPKAEVTIYPWKDSPEHIDEVVEHARRFLKAHESAAQLVGEGAPTTRAARTSGPRPR
jgi:pimeloyl-ACP methyl ester carboxylesterase